MSNKCEWKDDNFNPCSEFAPVAHGGKEPYVLCHGCNQDIKRPEPEVIIKQSGGTWVSLSEHKVNFLCIHPEEYPKDITEMDLAEQVMLGDGNWVQILDELEITDEIALLRPIVITSQRRLNKLYGVTEKGYVIMDDNRDSIHNVRIAKVSDL